MQLQTPRLILDPLRAGDAAALYPCRSHPEVARYPGWRPTSVDAVADFIARQARLVFGAADS